uniref:Uncharacterized protein n=1 Tax=Spermophilus dauricus TaxID=99837 RepID=A0A8C9PSX0_SPEDA
MGDVCFHIIFSPTAPNYDRSQWLDEKFKLGLDFPNEKKKPEFLETLPEKMKLYSQFLGKRPWFAGDKSGPRTFIAGVVLDPTCPSAGSPILPFLSHSQGLKKISTYMKSSQFLRSPLYLKVARWSNK